MIRPLTSKHRPGDLPEWIFNWRNKGAPLFPKISALVICGAAFSIFLTMVRVRVVPPMQPEGRKATLIYLNNGAETGSWALRAQEGGPFPSRFELREWPGMPSLEAAVLEAGRVPPQPHTPQLRDLPEAQFTDSESMVQQDERVFPVNAVKRSKRPDSVRLNLAPVIYPLSNLGRDELPDDLPAFPGKIDGSLTSSTWRLLVRLRADGSVAECVTLTGDSASTTVILETWLQGVRFKPAVGKQSPWVGLVIGFVNTITENGPDSH